jgi:hypothetical protein
VPNVTFAQLICALVADIEPSGWERMKDEG